MRCRHHLVLLLGVGAVACSQPASVRLEGPAPAAVWLSQPATLPVATVLDADGNPIAGAKIDITVEPVTAATVKNGQLRAVQHTAATVRWTARGTDVSVEAKIDIRVPDKIVIRCPVKDGPCYVREGQHITLKADVMRGNEVLPDPPVQWSVLARSILATAEPPGRFKALAPGPCEVTARLGPIVSNLRVNVSADRVDEISLRCVEDGSGRDTDACIVKASRERPLSIELSGAGHPALGFEKTWTVEDPSVAFVSDGMIRGLKIGKTKVQLEAGGSKAELKVEVWPPPCAEKVEAMFTYYIPRGLVRMYGGRRKVALECKLEEAEMCLDFYGKRYKTVEQVIDACCCRFVLRY